MIGPFTFIGVNATLSDKTDVVGYNLIGASTYISGQTTMDYAYYGTEVKHLKELSDESKRMFCYEMD